MGNTLPAPSLDNVLPEDLKHTGRALKLFDQAIDRKLAIPSEDGRLKFLAAVEHASAVGTSNPAGLFAQLVRRGLWSYATQANEDAARRRLREQLHVRPYPSRHPASRPWPSAGPSLSEDARLVQAVRSATIRAGIFRDPWPAFQARNPAWTRERWDAALAELGLC